MIGPGSLPADCIADLMDGRAENAELKTRIEALKQC